MNAYEAEVRYLIKNIDEFMKRLEELGHIKFEYSFTDFYYRIGGDPIKKNLRIRRWNYPERPTRIYLVKNNVVEKDSIKFKQSAYEDGKLKLYEGPLEQCREVLADLGFEPWFTVKKENAAIWEIEGFWTAVEYIEQLGWCGELEVVGDEHAAEKLKERLDILDIKEYTFKPVSALIQDEVH